MFEQHCVQTQIYLDSLVSSMSDDEIDEKELDLSNVRETEREFDGDLITCSMRSQADVVTKYKEAALIANSE